MAAGNTAVPPGWARGQRLLHRLLLFAHQQSADALPSPFRGMNGLRKSRVSSRLDFDKDQKTSLACVFQGLLWLHPRGSPLVFEGHHHTVSSAYTNDFPLSCCFNVVLVFPRNGGYRSRMWKLSGFFIFWNLGDLLKRLHFSNPREMMPLLSSYNFLLYHSFCNKRYTWE